MSDPPLDPQRFADRVGSWLGARGPEDDVVVSCRVRLARNVHGYPFVSRLNHEAAQGLCQRLEEELLGQRIDGETLWVDIQSASPLVRTLLRERHLASRDLAPEDPRLADRPGRAVAFGEHEVLSVMINEEDHLRMQSLTAGFSLREAWERVHELDLALEPRVGFACSQELGYLTGCPTNVGTGLRASVMLHLPALGLVRRELDKVFSAAQRTNLAVRGMYGEGSKAVGDFYQISNQTTLGLSEESLVDELQQLIPSIVDFERRVRTVLMDEQGSALEDRVGRSYGILRTARSLATDVALLHLSNVRLGACLGLVPGLSPRELNAVAIQIQKGHVHALAGESSGDLLDATERDRLRAAYLRRRFADPN